MLDSMPIVHSVDFLSPINDCSSKKSTFSVLFLKVVGSGKSVCYKTVYFFVNVYKQNQIVETKRHTTKPKSVQNCEIFWPTAISFLRNMVSGTDFFFVQAVVYNISYFYPSFSEIAQDILSNPHRNLAM